MGRIKNTSLFIVLFTSFIFSSCLKIGEYYLGLNMQPNMEDSPPIEGLNVFGVVKTGPTLDTINHFFEVHKMIDMLKLEDTLIVDNASIELERTTPDGESFGYFLDYSHEGLYFNTEIEVLSGDVWTYTCMYDTFMVQSAATVPNYPKMKGDILISENKGIEFSIEKDTTAHMYMVYIISGENFEIVQQLPHGEGDDYFKIKPEWELTRGEYMVFVFAYDRNLREYYTSSNTFFKPNAYRPPFTTVEGGYGVFGAMSSGLFMLTY